MLEEEPEARLTNAHTTPTEQLAANWVRCVCSHQVSLSHPGCVPLRDRRGRLPPAPAFGAQCSRHPPAQPSGCMEASAAQSGDVTCLRSPRETGLTSGFLTQSPVLFALSETFPVDFQSVPQAWSIPNAGEWKWEEGQTLMQTCKEAQLMEREEGPAALTGQGGGSWAVVRSDLIR